MVPDPLFAGGGAGEGDEGDKGVRACWTTDDARERAGVVGGVGLGVGFVSITVGFELTEVEFELELVLGARWASLSLSLSLSFSVLEEDEGEGVAALGFGEVDEDGGNVMEGTSAGPARSLPLKPVDDVDDAALFAFAGEEGLGAGRAVEGAGIGSGTEGGSAYSAAKGKRTVGEVGDRRRKISVVLVVLDSEDVLSLNSPPPIPLASPFEFSIGSMGCGEDSAVRE